MKKKNLHDYKPKFTRRQITSFSLDAEARKKLDGMDHPSKYASAAVETKLGFCPVCHGKWPRKSK